MSTVRIQVRRGTSSEWTSANPVLAAGEMGVETNTNLFKFGNGSSTWTALSYANNSDVAIGEISQDAINTALSMGSGLTKTYDDGANTITIAVDDAIIATVDYVDTAVTAVGNSLTGYIETGDRGTANGVASLDANAKIPESELDLDGVSLDIDTGGDISAASISTTELTATNITSGGHIGATNLTVSGNLTVTGTTTSVDTTNMVVTDPLIQLASGNNANTVYPGFVVKFNDGTAQHSGLARDSSDNKWKLFKGVTDEPTTNVNFAQGSLDTLAVGAIEATSATIGDVSNTELQYLNGVTSAVQTQFDDLSGVVSGNLSTVNNSISNLQSDITSLNTALGTAESDITAIENDLSSNYAPLVAPTISNATFTGTLALPNGSVNGEEIADNAVVNAKIAADSIDDSKIAPNAEIAQTKIAGLGSDLAEKAPLASPTFTGSVVLPSATSIGDVTATELGYLEGITSSVQTQIGAAATALSNHESDTTNVHGISDTSLLALKSEVEAVTAATLGLGNVDNTSDADKPVSTATETAIATAKSEAIAEVTAVIDSAPAALNTLNELAAALGDDENFAATVTASLDGKVASYTPISEKTSSYTLSSLNERDTMIEINSASATTVTVPTNEAVAFPIGTSLDILRVGAGAVDVVGASGVVTVNATPGLKLRSQWSSATLIKRATDTWVLVGDLSA